MAVNTFGQTSFGQEAFGEDAPPPRGRLWLCGAYLTGPIAYSDNAPNGIWTYVAGSGSVSQGKYVFGAHDGEVWVVGDGPRVDRWDGSSWNDESANIDPGWATDWVHGVDGYVFIIQSGPGASSVTAGLWQRDPSGVWTQPGDPWPDGRNASCVWAAAPDDVWVGGSYGGVARWDGAAYGNIGQIGDTGWGVSALWGFASDDVYATKFRAGFGGGGVFRWNGSAWSQWHPASSFFQIEHIHGTSANNIWICGEAGGGPRVEYWDGNSWTAWDHTQLGLQTNVALHRIHVISPTDVWVAGSYDSVFTGGTLLHYDGSSWTREVVAFPSDIRGVWSMSPPVPPSISNMSPDVDEVDVDRDAPISVDVTDPNNDLDASTVEITVDGVVAWTADAQANGWTGSKSAIFTGYRYTLAPPNLYPYGKGIEVGVTAEDVLGNALDDSWTFTALRMHIVLGKAAPVSSGDFLYSGDAGQTWSILGANSHGGDHKGAAFQGLSDIWGTNDFGRPRYGGLGGLTSGPAIDVGYNLQCLHASAPDNVWIGGAGGAMWHYSGGDKALVGSYVAKNITGVATTPFHIHAVHALSPTNVWAADIGSTGPGQVYHYNGSVWTEYTVGAPWATRWASVDASGPNNVVFCSRYNTSANTATVRRWNGSSFDVLDLRPSLSGSTTAYISDVFTTGPDAIWVTVRGLAADNGIWFWDGATWTRVVAFTTGLGAIRGWNSLVGIRNGTLIVALSEEVGGTDKTGPIAIYDGSTWTEIDSGINHGTSVQESVRALYVEDVEPPAISNKSPAPDETDVDADTPISFDVVDTSLDAASVVIWVDGLRAWENDAVTGDGFVVTKTAVTGGFNYSITKKGAVDVNWPTYSDVRVRVYASDTGGYDVDETWVFSTNGIITLSYDDFEDGIQSLGVTSGNGVTHPSESGGRLRVGTTVDANMDWYTFGRSGKLTYLPFSIPSNAKTMWFETELVSVSPSTAGNWHEFWGLYEAYNNAYCIYTPNGTDGSIHAYKIVNNSWQYQGSAALALPHRKRFQWDIDTNMIHWQYWSGSAWEEIVPAQAFEIDPVWVHFYMKDWTGVTTEAAYEYVKIYAELERSLPEATFEGDQAGYEDVLRLPTAGGPVSHKDPLRSRGVGQLLPGPKEQTPGSTGPFDYTGYEDRSGLSVGSRKRPGQFSRGQDNLTLGVANRQDGIGEEAAFRPSTNATNSEANAASLDAVGLEAAYEDALLYLLSTTPEFHHTTFDTNGRTHLTTADTDHIVDLMQYYDSTGEPWDNPTANAFSGFARNGKKYTNGVEDAGPVYAPWATEAPSNDRGTRTDFPQKALIVGKYNELVIFDLDFYDGTASSLVVWMRFKFDGTTNFRMLGRVNYSHKFLKMLNGTLCVVSDHNGIENGGLFLIDFKRDGEQGAGHLLRSDGHWWLVSGQDITNRNDAGSLWTQTGADQSILINDERVYRVDAIVSGTNDLYVVEAGEDWPRVLYVANNEPQWFDDFDVKGARDMGEANLNDFWYRSAVFDSRGWLWSTVGSTLYRHLDYYVDRFPMQDLNYPYQQGVELPEQIRFLVEARGQIYATTASGIYRVDPGTLEYWLAYTWEGGEGTGKDDANPGDGARIAGGFEMPWNVRALNLSTSSYLAITTSWWSEGGVEDDSEDRGAVTILRLYDDHQLQVYKLPTLAEDGAIIAVMVPDTF